MAGSVFTFLYGLSCGVLLTGVGLVALDWWRGEPGITITCGKNGSEYPTKGGTDE